MNPGERQHALVQRMYRALLPSKEIAHSVFNLSKRLGVNRGNDMAVSDRKKEFAAIAEAEISLRYLV